MENTSVNYIRLDSLTLSEEDVNELLMISPSQPGNTTNPFSQEISIKEVPLEIKNVSSNILKLIIITFFWSITKLEKNTLLSLIRSAYYLSRKKYLFSNSMLLYRIDP